MLSPQELPKAFDLVYSAILSSGESYQNNREESIEQLSTAADALIKVLLVAGEHNADGNLSDEILQQLRNSGRRFFVKSYMVLNTQAKQAICDNLELAVQRFFVYLSFSEDEDTLKHIDHWESRLHKICSILNKNLENPLLFFVVQDKLIDNLEGFLVKLLGTIRKFENNRENQTLQLGMDQAEQATKLFLEIYNCAIRLTFYLESKEFLLEKISAIKSTISSRVSNSSSDLGSLFGWCVYQAPSIFTSYSQSQVSTKTIFDRVSIESLGSFREISSYAGFRNFLQFVVCRYIHPPGSNFFEELIKPDSSHRE